MSSLPQQLWDVCVYDRFLMQVIQLIVTELSGRRSFHSLSSTSPAESCDFLCQELSHLLLYVTHMFQSGTCSCCLCHTHVSVRYVFVLFMSHARFSPVRVRVVKTYCICYVCVLSLAWCRTSTTGGVLTYLCCVVFDIRFLRSLIHYIFTVHLLHVFSRFSCHCFRYMSACCCCCNVIAVWVWKRGRASSAVQSTRC